MGVDERREESVERPTIFAIAPVRTRNAVSRGGVVAVLVGVAAFLSGIQVGSGGSAAQPQPPVPPSASSPATAPVTAATPALTAAAPAPVSAAAGSSGFVREFRPADLIAELPGGTGCATSSSQLEVPRTRRDGPRLTFVRSWMTFCPLRAERRQAFLLAVIDGLVRQVPSETLGYFTGIAGPGEALFPYAESPFVGEVTLSADSAGPGLEIVITLEERLAP